MNWADFQTYNESPTKAFEVLCNQLFENWCNEEYNSNIVSFNVVNGAGGDGGVESYAVLGNREIVGLQAKWFLTSITESQMNQIKNSIKTALKVRPQITRYIICVPRDLASVTARTGNTEDKRWNDLKAAMQIEFPPLTIDLWNETRLVTELQKASSAGIYRFWFEKSEISEESIRFSFSKSKESWLSTKYVPELNTFGEIDECISEFLGCEKQRRAAKLTFENISALCNEFLLAADELLSVCRDNAPQLSITLVGLQKRLTTLRQESDNALLWLNNETTFGISLDESVLLMDLGSITEQLKQDKIEHDHYFHFSELSKILKNLERIDIHNALRIIKRGSDRKSLLFLGEPGTGKTHGVAAESEKLLNEGYHIPILTQARDIPEHYTWKDIVSLSLGLSDNWSEDDIWQALSSLSNRKRLLFLDSEKQLAILPKVVIIIDGIDETSLRQKWIERVQETNAIVQKYPQIRFCITSRPYVFNQNIEYAKVINIGVSGDVPTFQLFSNYTKAYNINAINIGWLKYALTTPLALKLFCELNRHKTIEYYDRADISITTLIKEKINILEREFCIKAGKDVAYNQYIFKTIRLLAIAFNQDSHLERNKLINSIMENLSLNQIDVETLLTYLENYGILRLFCEHGSRYLSDTTYFYNPGIQGYFDYVSALDLLDEYMCPRDIDFRKYKYLPKNTLYTLTIISIQSFDYLLVSNPTIDTIVDPWFKEELYFIALRHSDPCNAEKYKEPLLQKMSESAEALISITNNIILPLSRDLRHPLGSALLNQFLSEFASPAYRDILWSVPRFLKGSYEDKWYCSSQLALNENEFALTEDDVAGGCPLVYAWALSSVNNLQRKQYRSALMTWSLLAPEEFYQLFLKFSFVNDPQIRSDIFSILMCLLFETENKFIIEKAVTWLIKNILAPDKIEENRDIAIRYYSSAIVQKAIFMGIMDRESAILFFPPYQSNDNYISLSKEALTGTRMGGYSAIDYDLARYVLIDHFTACFSEYDSRVKGQYERLIDQIIQEQPDYEGMTLDQLIISAAFEFITNSGWNKRDFYDYDRENKKARGVDCAIATSHHSATHGAQSPVMTICEKYVWQARNAISGFFADRLLYAGDDEVAKVSDYGLLDDFIIPIQEINQIDPDNISDNRPWHIPEKEVVILERSYSSKDDVINSIIGSPEINWEKWLFINNSEQKYRLESNNLVALGGFSCFYSPSGVETCLFISSVLIATDNLNQFVQKVSDDMELANKISNPTDWRGGIQSSCYITPKEVCWFPWKKRYNSSLVEEFPNIKIQSAVDYCCYNFQEYGDVYYDIPSAPVRDLLQISNADGYLFYNEEKKVKAEYCITGEKWGTYQDYLIADKEELLNNVEKSGNTLIWIMRESRREDGKSKEKFGEFYVDKNCCHIGFFSKGKFVTIQISSHKDNK